MSAGVVIIGTGQAGVEAASALRAQGYDEPILLIGEENDLPYQRPPLSKEYLLGKLDAARLPLRAEAFYEKHRIDVLTGQRVTVAGVVTHRQRPETARGITFVNLEDETGLVNVVCSIGVWARHRRVAQRSPALLVRGRVESAGRVINVVAERIAPLALGAPTGSRDFC